VNIVQTCFGVRFDLVPRTYYELWQPTCKVTVFFSLMERTLLTRKARYCNIKGTGKDVCPEVQKGELWRWSPCVDHLYGLTPSIKGVPVGENVFSCHWRAKQTAACQPDFEWMFIGVLKCHPWTKTICEPKIWLDVITQRSGSSRYPLNRILGQVPIEFTISSTSLHSASTYCLPLLLAVFFLFEAKRII
jgi:hypothetical protein